MALRPIDVKTPVVSNQESTRLRENQKTHDAGQGQFAAQQVQKGQEKFETVKGTDHTEGKVVRKEDEEGEKKQSPEQNPSGTRQQAQSADDKDEKTEDTRHKAEDLNRGSKLDIKA